MSLIHICVALGIVGYLVMAWMIFGYMTLPPRTKALRHTPVRSLSRQDVRNTYPLHHCRVVKA